MVSIQLTQSSCLHSVIYSGLLNASTYVIVNKDSFIIKSFILKKKITEDKCFSFKYSSKEVLRNSSLIKKSKGLGGSTNIDYNYKFYLLNCNK